MTGAVGGIWKLVLLSGAITVLAIGMAACGGEGETTGSSAGSTSAAGKESAQEGTGSATDPKPPSSEFEVPGGDNSVQRFGEEAGGAERRTASAVVSGYMSAVAKQDFEAQCSYLNRESVEPLERLADPDSAQAGDGSGCAKALSQLRASTPGSTFGAIKGPVGSLRVEGNQGFALYHGKDGVDYVLPLRLEGDEWKVASLVPVEL